MRKLLVLTLMMMVAIFSFGQEATTEGLTKGQQAKNNGNNAFRENDFLSAIKFYEEYLGSGEEGIADDLNTKNLYEMSVRKVAEKYMQEKNFAKAVEYYEKYMGFNNPDAANDGGTLFYYALAASKINKNDVAMSNFRKCIDLNYKGDAATIYIADIYRDANDDAKMKEVLLAGIEKYPDSKLKKNMISMITTPMLREASEPFSEANKLAKEAAGGSSDSYLASMEKAVAKFQEAIPLFENILKFDPANQNATTYLDACKENIQKFEEYKASVKK